MLIEGAFTKLPEVLIGYDDEVYLYEAGITNLFSNAILLELNARNIDNPLSKMFFEKRYGLEKNERCDVFTDFDFINSSLSSYGYYSKNWIEAKYYGNKAKKSGNMTKSKNAGSIAYDMYRLANNTKFANNMGLYSLVLFDNNPKYYLAMSRVDTTERRWLNDILTDGIHNFTFNLSEEPNTIKNVFKLQELNFNCTIRVLTFAPLQESTGFYGSLIQILDIKKLESN